MAEMLRPPASAGAPAAITKYLLPSEVLVATVRRHPRILATFATEALGAILIASILDVALAHDLVDRLVIWIPAGFLVLQALWAAGNWSGQYFVVTSERILVVGGGSVEMVPLAQLANLRFSRSLAGRVGGFGTFRYGPGARQVLLDYAPYPEELYLLLMELIFGVRRGLGDD
jgi:hypothetical protein